MKLIKIYKANEQAQLKAKLSKLFIFQGHRWNSIEFLVNIFSEQILSWNYEISDTLQGIKNLYDKDIGTVKLHLIRQSISDVIYNKQKKLESQKRDEDYKNWKNEPIPQKAMELIEKMKVKGILRKTNKSA